MSKEKQFVKAIQDNEGIIYKITRLYTDNPTDQQDLYQEIIFQLWKGFDSFKGKAKFSTWMYRVALNTALLYLKQKKRQGYKVPIAQMQLIDEAYDPTLEDRLKILYQKIKELKEIDRGIIFLFLEGKKYQEIASITGLSASNVGTRMNRIKKQLNNKLIKN